VAALSPAMWRAAEQAGERILALVEEDLRPRQVMTAGSFRNAVRVALSVGASINTVKHLQAVAEETGVDVDVLQLFADLGRETPLLSAVRPNGEHTIEQFDAAGGAAAVMVQLGDLLDTSVRTVGGGTLADDLARVTVADPGVIRPAGNPWSTDPLIVVLRGTLTPAGGIVKLSVDAERPPVFTGPARCFDDQAAAVAALAAGEVAAGDVVVLRGLGPRGRPGMGMASQIVFALDRAGLTGKVAVVTDGQLSGLVNRGVVVGEVRPEAADGGPLALVRDGDQVRVDLPGRRCDLLVDPAELATREPVALPDHAETGWLSVYRRTVRPLGEGAVLRPKS
jgi:dihydroxy-acid dehydratase